MKKLISAFVFLSLLFSKAGATQDNGWKIETTDYYGDYYGTIAANGGIGILPWKEPFEIKNVVLNHVFDANGEQGVSRALRGINPFKLRMEIDGKPIAGSDITGWKQTVDMRNAMVTTDFTCPREAEVNYSVYALRNLPYAGIVEVNVKALKNISLSFTNLIDVPDEYTDPHVRKEPLTIKHGEQKVNRTWAKSKHRGVTVSASSQFICDSKAAGLKNDGDRISVSLRKGEEFSFALIGAVCTDRDFIDPYNESDRAVIYGAAEGLSRLRAGHIRQWDEMWQSDIIIEGDDDAQRAVRFALYNLYSNARKGNRMSIPPFGLSSQGYNGHIFWDTEFWMYPPMLFLNQDIARSMMDYRTDRLSAACRRAMSYGYDGAMYPWESDDAGEESCPTWALTGPFEHHISADIAIAAWNYYRMTGDRQWLKEEGFPMMEKIAEFWVSRAEKNSDGTYSIRNIVCADEYAVGVDDNAFTNGAAMRALQAAVKAAEVCGTEAPAEWESIASGLRLPRFADGVTMEYEGYDGRTIKQADANLLAYPLGIVSKPEDIRKDLDYYESRIDRKGPAMSFAILALLHARFGDADKAYELFTRAYRPNQLPPFGVISEAAGGKNPYFATGAGGMLQTVINGFCGLELTDKGITQLPSAIPAHWKKLTITGVGPEKRTFTRTHDR